MKKKSKPVTRNSPRNAEHTPGPWYFVNEDNGETLRIETLEGGYIAEISRNPDENDHWEIPNAALISASPSLLAALKALVDWEQYMGGFESKEWKTAKAAIRKAEGRK